MSESNPRHGYKAFYGAQTAEIYADSLYEAKQKAIEAFKPPKSKQHMVSVVLAEKGGKHVTLSTGSIG